jgi:outer membrane protein assembly factor BamB
MHNFRDNQSLPPLPDDEPEIIDLDSPTESHIRSRVSRRIFRHLLSGQRFTRTARLSVSLLAVACLLFFLVLIWPTIYTYSHSSTKPSPTPLPPDQFTYNDVQVTDQVAFVDSINPYTSTNEPGHGTLNVFEAKTGHLLWKSNLYPPQKVLAANSVLYVQTYSGAVRALDSTSGRVIWQSPPIAVDGQLNSISAGVLFDVAPDATVFTLRISDGHILWNLHSHLIGIVMIQTVADTVYISSMQDKISYALQVVDGHLLWQYQDHDGGYIGAAEPDFVYIFTQQGTLDVLHAKTGTLLWSHTTIDPDGILYDHIQNIMQGLIILSSSQSSALQALHATDGSLAWRYKSNQSGAISALGITLWYGTTQRHVYDLSPDDDILRAFHLTNGSLAWSYNAGIPFSFLLQNDIIYLSYDRDGVLLALHADTGAVLWSYQTTHYTYVTAVADGIIYLQSEQGGQLYAVRANDHKLLWHQQIQSS